MKSGKVVTSNNWTYNGPQANGAVPYGVGFDEYLIFAKGPALDQLVCTTAD